MTRAVRFQRRHACVEVSARPASQRGERPRQPEPPSTSPALWRASRASGPGSASHGPDWRRSRGGQEGRGGGRADRCPGRGESPGETVRGLQVPPHGARAWAFGEVGGLQKTQERASCQAVVGDTPAPEVCSPVTFESGKRISVPIFR